MKVHLFTFQSTIFTQLCSSLCINLENCVNPDKLCSVDPTDQDHGRIRREGGGGCGGGGGGRGSKPPTEKSQKFRVFSNTGPDPLKITKLPSQNSMLGHHRHARKMPF